MISHNHRQPNSRQTPRALIYVEELHKLHDPVHDQAVLVADKGDLAGQTPTLGRQYSTLMRAATAASSADVRRLRPWQDSWTALGVAWGDLNRDVEQARTVGGDIVKGRETALAKNQPAIRAVWERLDSTLREYDSWLSWKLRKRWWWSRPIARGLGRVRVRKS